MAITQAICTSFKSELLGGIHDLDTDVIKMALFTSSATLSAATTAYAATNEASGTGYTAGGETMTTLTIATDGTTAYFDADDVQWTSSTFTCRGALIYNSSKSNRAICVLDFGSDVGVSSGTFTVQLPAPGGSTALLRLA